MTPVCMDTIVRSVGMCVCVYVWGVDVLVALPSKSNPYVYRPLAAASGIAAPSSTPNQVELTP